MNLDDINDRLNIVFNLIDYVDLIKFKFLFQRNVSASY